MNPSPATAPETRTPGIRERPALALVAVMTAATFALLPTLPDHGPTGPITLTLWMVFALTVASELASVHRHGGGHTHTLSFSEVTLVMGLAFATPGDLMLGRMLAGIVVYVLVRRLPVIKAGLNLALLGFETSAAAAVYHAVLGRGAAPVGLLGSAAAVLAVAVTALISLMVIKAIVATHGQRETSAETRRTITISLLMSAVGAVLGLLAVGSLWTHPVGFAVAGIGTGLAYLGVRAYVDLVSVENRRRVATAALASVEDLRDRVVAALRVTRSLVRVDHAEVMLPLLGEAVARVHLGPESFVDSAAVHPMRAAGIVENVSHIGPGAVAVGRGVDDGLRLELKSRGFRRPALVPICRDGCPIGYLAVGSKRTPEWAPGRADLAVMAHIAGLVEEGLPAAGGVPSAGERVIPGKARGRSALGLSPPRPP